VPTIAVEAEPIRIDDVDGVVRVGGTVDGWSTKEMTDRLIRQIAGVGEVVNELRSDYDDRDILGTGVAYGVA
jgi:hypothetical protein